MRMNVWTTHWRTADGFPPAFEDNESLCNIFLTLARRQAIISYGMYFPRLAPDNNRVEINDPFVCSFFILGGNCIAYDLHGETE